VLATVVGVLIEVPVMLLVVKGREREQGLVRKRAQPLHPAGGAGVRTPSGSCLVRIGGQ